MVAVVGFKLMLLLKEKSRPMNHLMIGAFISGLFLVGCGQSPSHSETKYAIYPGERTVGGPIGRIELIKNGFTSNFSKVPVCVEVTSQPITTEEFLLETKLAHAMWLNSAGYNERDFDLFEFSTKTKCSKTDLQAGTVVAIADFANEASGDNFKTRFKQPRIKCEVNGTSKRCTGTTTTLGWGGPGGITRYTFPSTPNKWVRVENSAPSTVLMSPFYEWHSLRESIAQDKNLNATNRSNLRNSLEALSSSRNPRFVDLVKFGNELTASRVLTIPDPVFPAKAQAFYSSGKASIDDEISPKLSVFNTLLHEVGHTFGLHHADNPAAEAITGPSSSTTWDEARKQFITSKSVMAYSDSFAYLTDDDVKGVQASAAESKKTVASHK